MPPKKNYVRQIEESRRTGSSHIPIQTVRGMPTFREWSMNAAARVTQAEHEYAHWRQSYADAPSTDEKAFYFEKMKSTRGDIIRWTKARDFPERIQWEDLRHHE